VHISRACNKVRGIWQINWKKHIFLETYCSDNGANTSIDEENTSGSVEEIKPGVIDQFKTLIGGVFGKEQKLEALSESTIKPDAGEQVKKPLQGHLEVSNTHCLSKHNAFDLVLDYL